MRSTKEVGANDFLSKLVELLRVAHKVFLHSEGVVHLSRVCHSYVLEELKLGLDDVFA